LSGDTIINDKLYNKLYLLNDTTLNIDENDVYVGGFREENKQVWFLLHDHAQFQLEEYLMYDFSKEVGEIIQQEVPVFQFASSALFKGSLSLIDLKNREITAIEDSPIGKMVHLDDGVTWVEGIGSINAGLFWDYYDSPLNGHNHSVQLACFKQGENVIYKNSDCNTCFCPDNWANIQEKQAFPISVIFNKRTSLIEVFSNQSHLPYSFELLNLQGQTLLKETVSSSHQVINYNGVNKGVYLYKTSDRDGVLQSGKIILE
jgi:hypothetical protein